MLQCILTMSNSMIKIVLIFQKIWSAEKSNTNVVGEVFSGTPTNQTLGFAKGVAMIFRWGGPDFNSTMYCGQKSGTSNFCQF
jgi:hypothetical protein